MCRVRQRARWRVWPVPLVSLVLAAASATIANPSIGQTAPTLTRATLPAKGRQETVLTVSKFGRYAITVQSAQGTGLQLLDRIVGPGDVQGAPGASDGRLDVFLDRGDHKIITHAHDNGSGEARVAVHSFTERNAPQPPLLVEFKPVDGTLDDFEQISYWLEIKERRQVSFEAAGRNLVDLRVWSSGDWLVDAEPRTEVVTPEPGHPLLTCRLTTSLEPGFYLLTAYGGAPQPWAEQSTTHPFHLRFGIPRLGEVGRSRHTIGPFGIDRYRVPGSATYYRVELPEALPVTLTVGTFDERYPFSLVGNTAGIEKNSLLPVAESQTYSGDADHRVTITGAAGQPYVLQYFDLGHPYFGGGRYWVLGKEGPYWISTVHSGDPVDSVDATALLTRVPRHEADDAHREPVATQVVELGPQTSWARRCNLLDALTVFVHIQKAGAYEIVSQGTEARFRIEPFLIDKPSNYQPPELQATNVTVDLDAGYYVLTADPVKKGILDLAIQPAHAASIADLFSRLLGTKQEPKPQLLRAAAQFSEVTIDEDYLYTLFLNQQPEVKVGLVARRLPLDLSEPLPVVQRPDEPVSIRFTVDEPGTLHATAEDGSFLAVAVDGAAPQTSQLVKKGAHTLLVGSGGDTQVHYALAVEPLRLQASNPLPALPDPARAAPPKFTVLNEKVPQFFDLDRYASKTFLLRADAPALYRLQSTGLLSTEGSMRTRIITSFARASENGVGHNLFVQQYLREGDYQVTVSTLHTSKGHLGLTLERTQLIDGGVLSPGIAAHIALPAGEAVGYRFTISAPGEYRLRSIGAGTTFKCRLEDADGWPIVRPNIEADLTEHFEPGTYRLVSMPEPVAARRLTLLERIPKPTQFEGHGPHTLPLALRVHHVWLEPNEGAARVPDTWEFMLPAAADTTISLTDEMEGTLVRVNDDLRLSPIGTLPPGRGWKGMLPAGHYRLEASCVRPNNQQPYEISVQPEQLVAGLSREITAPATIPLAVGPDSLIQLGSFGSSDVRARLYDDHERLIASNDDGPDDWNFQMQIRLTPGTYRLQVDPVGKSVAKVLGASNANTSRNDGASNDQRGPCTVTMRAPSETEHAAVSLPVKMDTPLGDAAQLYPLSIPDNAGLLLVAARASEGVGLAIEARADGSDSGWRTLGSAVGRVSRLEVPPRSQQQYRLRLWSADGRSTAAQLNAVTVNPTAVTEQQLQAGAPIVPVTGMEPPAGVVAVRVDRPGVFHLQGEAGTTRSCSAPDTPCAATPNDLVGTNESVLWLVPDISRSGAKQKTTATRVILTPRPEDSLQVEIATGQHVVCDMQNAAAGPVLALATSTSGQPGVRLTSRDAVATPVPDGQGMAVGTWSAAAVALGAPHPVAVVWSATATGEPIAVRLRQLTFAPPAADAVAWGSWDAAVPGLTARALQLPSGPKRLRIALEEATVAVLSEADRVTSVHWRGNAPFEETVEGTADRLTILHTREAEDPVHVEILPIAVTDIIPPLATGSPYERTELRSGVSRLSVPPAVIDADRPHTLHVRTDGATSDPPVFIGADGGVARGVDLPVQSDGGTLLVPHGPGLVLAWVDRRGDEAQDLWGPAALPSDTTLGAPMIVSLAGTVQSLRFQPTQPLMLHVRTSTPVVTLLRRGDAAPEVEVHGNGTMLDAYLTAQPTQLGLRAIGGSTLWGTAEVTTSPVTPIGEGLGPEVLLSAGATRLFSFAVNQDGPIGIGVRANPDVVDCTLLDAAGRRLGSGVVQMPTLKRGTYLLALHAPPNTGPIPARPALAGVELPSTGPPEDVVRGYVKMATEPEPPASSGDEE